MKRKRIRSLQSMALEQLILAFEKGERNFGSVEWEDLETAFQLACAAMPGVAKRVRKILDDQRAKDEAEAFRPACKYGYSPETCAKLCQGDCR